MSTQTSGKIRRNSNFVKQKLSNSPRSSASSKLSSNSMSEDTIRKIEEKYPNIVNQEIKTLRAMKKEAIENFEFNKSNDIQTYINFVSNDNVSKHMNVIKEQLRIDIIECFKQYDQNIQIIEKNKDNAIDNIDKEILNQQNLIEFNQSNEVDVIENDQKKEAGLEAVRLSSEVRSMLSQSQKLAHVDEYKEAKDLKEKAIDVQTQQIKDRIQIVDTKYKNILLETKKKHQNQIQSLYEKRDSLIEAILQRRENELNEQNKKIIVFIKYIIQQAIIKIPKHITQNQVKTRLINDILQTVRTTIAEEGREAFLPDLEGTIKLK